MHQVIQFLKKIEWVKICGWFKITPHPRLRLYYKKAAPPFTERPLDRDADALELPVATAFLAVPGTIPIETAFAFFHRFSDVDDNLSGTDRTAI